jgi:phosphatidylglycerophosphate synthase
MLDRQARPLVTRLLRPVGAGPLAAVPPLAITAVGLVVGLGAATAAAAGLWAVAVLAWLVNRFLDGLDGVTARQNDAATDVGGYLDMVSDVTVYAALPLGVAAGSSAASAWPAAAFLIASFYLNIVAWTYLAAQLERRGRGAEARGELTSITMPKGLIEGAETVVFVTVILLLPAWSTWTMAVMAVAVGLSAALHVANGIRLLGAQS